MYVSSKIFFSVFKKKVRILVGNKIVVLYYAMSLNAGQISNFAGTVRTINFKNRRALTQSVF